MFQGNAIRVEADDGTVSSHAGLMPAAKEPFSFDPAKYDLERTIGAAGNFLNQFRPFQDFLRSIRQGAEITPYQTNDPFDLGIFELPRSDQMLIDRKSVV